MSTDWYKDAILYEIHVKAFFDADGNGIGDFAGLTAALDYIRDLGVDCVWVLPMYPSPLRDDGYDIADFRGIHPDYGTVEDFQKFLDAAHARGLRVIADLVLNHTSDAHPWFQASRVDPTSPYAEYYVWSPTDRRYADARVIFVDAEKSNWTWDARRQAYYWHRFFSHQPDLNYDSPAVRRAMLDVMRFWLDVLGSAPVPAAGAPVTSSVEPVALDVDRMVGAFRRGLRDLGTVWEHILTPETLGDVLSLDASGPARFRFPDELWARVVYDFALGHHFGVVYREHLLRSFVPLYLGRTAAFVVATRDGGVGAAEAHLERVGEAFERGKRYLVERWR